MTGNINKRILIVDDDKPIAKAYEAGLSNAGFAVETVFDGVAAIEAINRTKPDLIMLDMIMPVMDGEAVLDKLQADHLLEKIPVFIITNSINEADMVKREGYEVAGYVVKSNISMDDLTKKIKGILSV